MSIADQMAQTDLASSTRVLERFLDKPLDLRPLGDLGYDLFDDPELTGWELISQAEIYLRAIAVIEASLQLGLKNPLGSEEVSFAKRFLSNESIASYCSINRLALPLAFLARLMNSRSGDDLKLSSDRAIRSHVERIDHGKPQQSVISAFHDLITVGVYTLGGNSFLQGVRTNLLSAGVVLDRLKDRDQFQEILGLAARIESEGGPVVGFPLLDRMAEPADILDNLSNASVLVAFSRFQLLMADIDSALKTIEEVSANSNSVKDLVCGHIIPDSGRIADRVTEIADAVTAGMVEAFRLRRKRSGASTGQQVVTRTTGLGTAYSSTEYLDSLALFADDDFEGDAFYPLPETLKVDGSQIVLRFARESAYCIRTLRKFDWTVFNLRVDNADDATFRGGLTRRAIFLTRF